MADIKSTTIVPIAFYCFVLAVYFLSLAVNVVWGSKEGLASTDLGMWLTVVVFITLMSGVIAIGIGILQLKPLCWKLLFFSLAICVSCIASFVIAFLIFLMINIKILAPYYHAIQNSSGGWFAFLAFFLSEIIILYYLSSSEVVACFGDMGPILSPF